MDESVRLLTLQQQLEKESDGKIAFFGLSINETLHTCIVNGMAKRADKIKSDFKVPDKRLVTECILICSYSYAVLQVLVLETTRSNRVQ